MEIYDTIIIGTGAAGYGAAIYNTRYQLKTLVIGKEEGGMTATSYEIENYPGFESIPGMELMDKMKKHAQKFGAEVINDEVTSLVKEGDKWKVHIKYQDKDFYAHTVLIGMGSQKRKLNIPGEKEFYAKGVTYCFTCDGFFYRDRITVVVGGGNAAVEAAIYLSGICKQVYIVHRGPEFVRPERIMIEKMNKIANITQIMDNNVSQVNGGEKVESINLEKEFNGSNNLKIDGLFIEIGSIPGSHLAKEAGAEIDESGFIVVNPKQATTLTGLYAAGDITTNSNKFAQTLTGAAEGAIASNSIYGYVSKL